jgi:biotin carboxylase
MAPYLSKRCGVYAPSMESVLKCEHKYWSRVEQSKVFKDGEYPEFERVYPYDKKALSKMKLNFPFWLKPVKATGGHLGFLIEKDEDFYHAIAIIRKNIPRIAKAFNFFLSQIKMPEEMAGIDGHYCIAEKIIGGRQCTVSGYVYDGQIRTYGLVDSFNYENTSSFFRYQYPSLLPEGVQKRIQEKTVRIISRIDLDYTAFNIEYFYDEEKDHLWLLEINPRMSQSHAEIYNKVDGYPNQDIIIHLSQGLDPDFPYRKGEFNYASKFYVRHFENARVAKIPTEGEIEKVRREMPDVLIDLQVKEGMLLSDLQVQDSYSYELAHVYIGGKDQDEILKKYDRCLENLTFEFEEIQE